MTKPEGAPIWLALRTSNPDGAIAFYGELLGWTAQRADPPGAESEDGGGNINFALNGALVASMDAAPSENGSAWTVFLHSPDIERTASAIVAAGGTVKYAAQLGDIGGMIEAIDSTGADVGVWQPGTHEGFGVEVVAGAPAWHELNTKDFAGARDFYRDVFGWTTTVIADSDDFRYATFDVGDETYSGIHDSARELDADERSHWISYFEIADAEAAKARIVELGGAVLSPTWDSPYGKVTVVTDPFGARFVALERPPA